MNKTYLTLILTATITILFSGCAPSVLDVTPTKDARMYAGKGEVCKNRVLDMYCQEGLECVELEDEGDQYPISVCLPEDYTFEEYQSYKEVFKDYGTNQIEIKPEKLGK